MTISQALELFELADAPSDELVKRTYRNVARIVHPDRHAGSETATQLLKRYTVARECLLGSPQHLRVRSRGDAGARAGSPGSSRAEELQQQLEHAAALSRWLMREIPRGRTAQFLVAGTALFAIGALALKTVEDSLRT